MIVATKYCERCNRWFCQTHFGDPDCHSERALLGRDRNLVFARQPLNCPVERGFLPFYRYLQLAEGLFAPRVERIPNGSGSLADFFFDCDSLPFAQSSPREYHRANTHHLRPIEAGEACSREPDPRPRKGRYILLLSILLRREMPLRISFTTSS